MKEPFLEQRKKINNLEITQEKWQEALFFASEHINDLIMAAKINRDNAFSYREFKVGCAVAGIGSDGEYVVYQGYNFKPQPGHVEGGEKRCAERNVLDEAQSDTKAVFAIVTVSKEIDTGDPTKAHDALHPCRDCRTMFRELLKSGFLKEDTIILNANDSGEKIITEKRTLKELLDLYSDDIS